MDTDPRIMDTMGGVRSEVATRQYLSDNIGHWEEMGYGLWILRLRADDSLVGRAYLRRLHIAERDEIAVGYALLPEFWRKGLATEIAIAIVRIAFEQVGLEDVVIGVLPDNLASQRVIEKVGGRFEVETTYKGVPHLLYRVSLQDHVPS